MIEIYFEQSARAVNSLMRKAVDYSRWQRLHVRIHPV
jgi:hypothetical protein